MADIDISKQGMRLRVSGLRKTLNALSKAGADSQDMKTLMHSIGMIVVRASNPPVQSGALAATLRAGKGKTKAVVRAGGARTPYAGVVHYGWPARGIQANPFLLNALDATKQDVFNKLEDGIDDILRKNSLK